MRNRRVIQSFVFVGLVAVLAASALDIARMKVAYEVTSSS